MLKVTKNVTNQLCGLVIVFVFHMSVFYE